MSFFSAWLESTGWCVDANGQEAGRNPNQDNVTESDCFAQCTAPNSNLQGCTHDTVNNKCITYTGNIVQGSQYGGYICHHRGNKQKLL